MAASLAALRNDQINTGLRCAGSLRDTLHLNEELDPPGMGRSNIRCWVGKGMVDRGNPLLKRHLHQVIDTREG